MNMDSVVEILSEDRQLYSTLAAVVSTLSGCRIESGLSTSTFNGNGNTPFLILRYIDFSDESACTQLLSWLSQRHEDQKAVSVILIADNACQSQAAIEFETQLMNSGVFEILGRPVNLQRLRYIVETLRIKNFGLMQRRACQPVPPQHSMLRSKLDKIKGLETNVLLTGETGVGKTFWAEEIHRSSPRAKHPFVVINCANYSAELAESQLFGHAKGAFTGADQRHTGQLEHAGKGTVFLDEIDSLSLPVQAKLLRVVENREFRPLGDHRTIPLKARILCATNQNLDDLVDSGAFRADLFYRLNAYEIKIPSLRERRDEIEYFCQYFALEFAKVNRCKPKQIEPDAIGRLQEYPWPGNLRELRNCVQQGLIESDGDVVRWENFPLKVREHFRIIHARGTGDFATRGGRPFGCTIDRQQFDRVRQLVQALDRNNYNRSKAAKELGVSRMTVYNMLQRYGLG